MRTVCHCCEPDAQPTPLTVENRPSLSAIAYRMGTYSSFREAMLLGLAGAPELAALTTRRSDDYAITVLDLWAAVADVLTFYQERYANEAFLRTAQFRDSIGRLADLIGYRLGSGVAARASIAFTLDKDKSLEIPAGQKVQSVPEAGQQPQTFETLESLSADARWNSLRVYPSPVTVIPLQQGSATEPLDRLQGPSIAAALAAGDAVVLFNDGSTSPVEEKKIAAVRFQDDRVIVTWDVPVKRSGWNASTKAFRFRRTFKWFGHNAPNTYVVPSAPAGSPTRISWSLTTLGGLGIGAGNVIHLDGKYENLAVGQKLLIADTASGGTKTLVTVEAVRQVNASFGPLSDTVTELTVDPDAGGVAQVPAIGNRRSVVIYELAGDTIVFSSIRYPASWSGDVFYLPGIAVADPEGLAVEVGRTIERDKFKPGVVFRLTEIEKGRTVLLVDESGAQVVGTIKEAAATLPAAPAPGEFCHLVLSLSLEGTASLNTESARLLGNVAAASHGETVADEVLGNGDASLEFQRFALKKKPLTYLPASGPAGVESTLDVTVNGVRWKEVPQLYGQPFDAPVYELRTADDGTTIVQFGDGVTGARVPTGAGNLVAKYRMGTGLAGRVGAESLTTLLARPTGLSGAVNPLAAEGGADPETAAMARWNAPGTVRTFGRIVSLLDFADQVTASGEFAKAHATWVWNGYDRGVHLTIAGQAGGTFSEEARRDLGVALRSVRDPNHRLSIDNYAKVFVEFHAGVGVDSAYDADTVVAACREAALDALSFDRLRLGQAIHLSDLYRVLQDVPGVIFVDIDRLMYKKPAGMSVIGFLIFLYERRARFQGWFMPVPVQPHLRIFSARPSPAQPGVVLPAELAWVESPSVDLVITVKEVA